MGGFGVVVLGVDSAVESFFGKAGSSTRGGGVGWDL